MLKRANPCLARPKPTRRIVSASALAFLLAGASAARAADTQVDLQLVLAVDASGSVNQRRFNL